MQIFGMNRLILIGVASFVVSGCASMSITGSADVNKNAFGAKKKFAVVSIAALKTFRGEQGMAQMFKNNDDIPGMNTQPLINKLSPKIMSALDKSKYFSLVPENTVLGSKAYKNFAEDERVMKILFMSETMNTASNYKYVSDEKKFAKLANDLGVDGVIGITMNFTVATGGGALNIYGVSLGKKSYSASATAMAIAYNKKGEVIWKDSTTKEAEPGDTKAIVLIDISSVTDTGFEKLHPSAIEIGGKAVDVLLSRFNDTMAGKETSRFQSVK